MKFAVKSLLSIFLTIQLIGCDKANAPVGKMPTTLEIGKKVPDFIYQDIFAPSATSSKNIEKYL